MKIAFFDTHEFERPFFSNLEKTYPFEIKYYEPRLNYETANLASGFEVVCAFVNDHIDAKTISILEKGGTKLIALRSAGFNNVDLKACVKAKIRVVRVPEYSPHAVAEHAVALILTLNRKIHRAYNRVREGNFSLNNLVGFDLYQKTIGVVGTGRIGSVMAKIMLGFGCKVLAFDKTTNSELKALGVEYGPLESMLLKADIISLHVPLNPQTFHLLNAEAFSKIKPGAMIINTGRGALIDTKALVSALKGGRLGFAGLDVYEEEEGVFFEDHSDVILKDDLLARLLTFPNVIMTSHQAFLTKEALASIAETTYKNIYEFYRNQPLTNEVLLEKFCAP